MENEILLERPESFTDYGESVMSNFDHEVNEEVAKAIKGEEYFAQYAGWNFCGYVWWQGNQWHCEVWRYNSHIKTVSAETLKEIMTEVSDEYGYD